MTNLVGQRIGLLWICAILGIGSIVLEYLQHLFGFFSSERLSKMREKVERKTDAETTSLGFRASHLPDYDDENLFRPLRFAFFFAKQLTVLAGSALVLYVFGSVAVELMDRVG